MGRLFIKHYDKSYLKDDSIYKCKNCDTHLALTSKIISREFRGTTGTAYLFDNCINVFRHSPERRELATGMHTVGNITCICCNKYLGWYYYDAENPSQEYKIDKYILECHFIKRVSSDSDSTSSPRDSTHNISRRARMLAT